METPREQRRGHGKMIALTALALSVALVLFVWLGLIPTLEQEAIEAELAAQEAAEWEEREAEAKREAWKTLGDPELVYGNAAELLELVQEEEAKL
jgi:hypothetical protein